MYFSFKFSETILTRNFTPYIYILFLLSFSKGIFAQKINLKVKAKDSIENTFLKKFEYQHTHTSLKSLNSEIKSISKRLKQAGYFYNRIDSTIKNNSTQTVTFKLGLQLKNIVIKLPEFFNDLMGSKNKHGKIKLKTEDLTNFLNSISNRLEDKGRSFSKTKLENVSIKGNNLYAELKIYKSITRKIDKVIIKGYENFPKSYIKHYYKISNKTISKQQELKEISTKTKSLTFIKEVKPPEILFSKDSTLLYMYIKKRSQNSFDALIGFNSKENSKGIIFNGHVNFELNNLLSTGEQFKLSWKSNGEKRQSFETSTIIPYIFNSAITPSIKFNIHKQDSAFISTKLSTKLKYSLSKKTSINFTLNSGSSSNTLINNNLNIKNFKNTFYGIEFTYKTPNKNPLFKNTFLFRINPSFGNRKIGDTKTKQFKTLLNLSYLLKLRERSFLFIKNNSGILNSNNLIKNELFRIGGIKTIRGLNEESIFTSKFTTINIEYRYLTSSSSFLYSITDYGINNTISSINQKTLSLGLGYFFPIKKSIVNLSYTLNNRNENTFNFKNSMVSIIFKSYF